MTGSKNIPRKQRISHKLILFIRFLFYRQTSAFITIFGRRGTGKTDFALLIAEILVKYCTFKHVASNIDVKDDAGLGIRNISNLDDLKEWCRTEKGRKLYVFDEIGRTVARRKPMSSLNVSLINEFQVLRKFKLSIIACTINPKYVDNAVLGDDILDGSFIKPYLYNDMKRNQKIALYQDLLRRFTKRLGRLPGTSVDFDTWGTAVFTEHGPIKKPKFKDEELSKLWDWAQGKSIKETGWSRSQFHRKLRKFVSENLEFKRTT